jgi:hypothetical protein
MPNRPAETGGVTAAVAVLIAYLAGLREPSVIIALTVVIGFVPAAITWLVVMFRRPPRP